MSRQGTIPDKITATPPGQRLVLTARTADYREAVQPPDGIEVRLTGAAGVELRPLDTATVADYLRTSAGGPIAAQVGS